MKFKYEAMDATGLEIKDTIEADNEQEAQRKIREKGFYVTRIRAVETDDIVVDIETPTSSNHVSAATLFIVLAFGVGTLFGILFGFALAQSLGANL